MLRIESAFGGSRSNVNAANFDLCMIDVIATKKYLNNRVRRLMKSSLDRYVTENQGKIII